MERGQTSLAEAAFVTLLALVCLASRLAEMGSWCEDWDGGSFVLGLSDYDLELLRPHFPGYPLYMAAAFLVRPFAGDDVRALVLPSAVFGALAIVPLYGLARDLFGRRTAGLAAALYMVNPLAWLAAEKVGSDAMGLAFLLAAAWALSRALRSGGRRRLFAAASGLSLGLALGVRLDLAPAALVWGLLVRRAGAREAVGGLLAGVLVWAVPLAGLVGPARLASIGVGFVAGHFSDWGGSVVTRPDLAERTADFAWLYLAAGLGAWWGDASPSRLLPTAVLGVGLVAFLRRERGSREGASLLAALATLALWVYFAQNLERPRHALALVPWTLVAAARGLDLLGRESRRGAFLGLSALAVLPAALDSARLVRQNAAIPPPSYQVVRYAAADPERDFLRVYGGETRRVFEVYEPDLDARRARDVRDLDRDLRGSWVFPRRVLVTSSVAGAPAGTGSWTLVARFRTSRYLHAPDHDLAVYRYVPPYPE